MARRRFGFVAIWSCVHGALLAAPPSDAKSTDHTKPSPNQSLSIEEMAAEPAEQGGERSDNKAAGQDVTGVVADPAPGRTPTFLSRKRSAEDAERPAAGIRPAPWYRTSYGALALVLTLMAVLYFGLKRWAPSMKVQDAGLVRVMGRTVVGPRQSLVLLNVGRRVVLVGVSPDRIDRVCEIADAEEVAAITAQSPAGPSHGQFSAWLDREAAAFVDTAKPGGNEIPTTDKRSGSKSLSELLQKLRTTKV